MVGGLECSWKGWAWGLRKVWEGNEALGQLQGWVPTAVASYTQSAWTSVSQGVLGKMSGVRCARSRLLA